MSENETERRSISAIVNEMGPLHTSLGIPVDPEEFCEAWEIINQIERRLSETKANAWRERWNTTPTTT
jgi:hypothetical protein